MANILGPLEIHDIIYAHYAEGRFPTTYELSGLCNSHEALRELVKDLLVELMSKGTDNSKDIIKRAQSVVE